jgi:SOS-response transcriptional repressor LexA
MELKTRIAEALAIAKKTPTQVAADTGLSDSAISQLLSGKTKNLRANSAVKLEASTGVRASWLVTGEGPKMSGAITANVSRATVGVIRIPMISYVQAGVWTTVYDNFQPGDADEFLLTDMDLSEHAFALEIKGESMLPEFKPGDRVIIDPLVQPNPGDFVVAKNGEDEATFKKYRPRGMNERGDPVFELVPLNDDYPSMRSDQQPIQIIGTMIEHRKYRKK